MLKLETFTVGPLGCRQNDVGARDDRAAVGRHERHDRHVGRDDQHHCAKFIWRSGWGSSREVRHG